MESFVCMYLKVLDTVLTSQFCVVSGMYKYIFKGRWRGIGSTLFRSIFWYVACTFVVVVHFKCIVLYQQVSS